ncbi:MAG: hypothetical protein M1135_03555 [Candidatus Omnitrophica bacterium]|jgi:hypothetical protein|nr:hypothetical protein [Candidatus Omnitrophota bacterium]
MENLYQIKLYLDYYRKLEIKNKEKENFFIFISCLIIFLFLILLTENIFFINIAWERTIKSLFIFIIAFIFLKSIFDFVLWHRMSYEKLSLLIEQKTFKFNNHLINSWQLSTQPNSYSKILIKKIAEDAILLLKGTNISKSINRKKLFLYRKIALLGVLFLCMYIILFHKNFRTISSSLFMPFSHISSITPIQKKLLTSNLEQAPYVQIIKPGKDIAVNTLNISIPLKIVSSDNSGLGILSLKYHIGPGEISSNDPVFFQKNLKNVKEDIISTFLKIPSNLSTKLAYYAECTNNNPAESEMGRSTVFFVYPPSMFPEQLKKEAAKNQYEKIKQLQTKMKKINKQLKNFITSQTSIIKATKKIGNPKNFAGEQDLKSLAEKEEKWLQTFQKLTNDLNNMGIQTKGKFTLAKELVEMMDHVQSAEYGMMQPITTIAVTQAEMGLELAKEITSNIEKWLAQSPDNVNWKMPQVPEAYNVPQAPLPSELEDMIGDLIQNEQNMQSNIEETTKWMDSLDKGAGWSVADGPISDMSAKGITGNLMPGSQEVGGRSGEGRTGRSYGEMVGNTAIGKGGRLTPAELTPDNLEPGIIKDKSGENPLGPTGGGKISGLGPEGLQGPTQSNYFTYNLLDTQQKKLIEKAESIERSMIVFNVYNPQLQQAISAMKKVHMEIKGGRYTNLLTTTHFIISNLRQTQNTLIKNDIINMENNEHISKQKYNSTGIWEEKIPPGYENVIWKYYSKIFNH